MWEGCSCHQSDSFMSIALSLLLDTHTGHGLWHGLWQKSHDSSIIPHESHAQLLTVCRRLCAAVCRSGPCGLVHGGQGVLSTCQAWQTVELPLGCSLRSWLLP